ncbi:MAG: TIGR01212 family radical SAM protein [Butyrivibrio sp.]|nr:TIGR01212 family radical SAM protein [Butyrivibrio sp.]
MNGYYYSVNDYYKELFGHKVYKISLNAGMSCPNRDGRIGTGGCIFCSEGGSGDFASSSLLSVKNQIDYGIEKISKKYTGDSYIAYFQAFTNTYAPVDRLKKIFTEAIQDNRICGLSIATRPDCLEDDKIELLAELNRIKPVWIELGLQTINETTARYIRRGYPLAVFEDAVARLNAVDIPVVVHVIVGLPGENANDNLACAKYLSHLNINGVKIQLLHILIVDMIEILPPHFVIHRVTGDGPKNLLIAPTWSADKKNVLNNISHEFKNRNTYQGKEYRHGS